MSILGAILVGSLTGLGAGILIGFLRRRRAAGRQPGDDGPG